MYMHFAQAPADPPEVLGIIYQFCAGSCEQSYLSAYFQDVWFIKKELKLKFQGCHLKAARTAFESYYF